MESTRQCSRVGTALDSSRTCWKVLDNANECGAALDNSRTCWKVFDNVNKCGTALDSPRRYWKVLDNARKYLTVLNSAGEHGTALDSAIEHDIDTMGTITYYNFSDVTMSHYGKFLSLLMQWPSCSHKERVPKACQSSSFGAGFRLT